MQVMFFEGNMGHDVRKGRLNAFAKCIDAFQPVPCQPAHTDNGMIFFIFCKIPAN